ncbi:PSD1 and planctomycete cytochrome C domain-containing protein [Anatilimnocola aggregata]|uniref:PSD1 and planctomycete cytochrome C domain-containing protein n=1 Tax=Anatilimnocola aggregata TaxID=2528021 RepID=UPI001EE3C185|nr:PSD1 and planctomycete cytochrome C domain-containing protein [Anatilimnocola aggregata]
MLVWLVSCLQCGAAEDASGLEFFESKIRPVLAKHCYQCHSVGAKKAEGGLRLDSRDALQKGGDRGPAILLDKPEHSPLLVAISHSDSDLKMPPKKDRLPQDVINDFTKWIRMGAPDPREAAAAGTLSGPVDLETGRKFWSFRQPTSHDVPKTSDSLWARRKLDHFILAKLEAAQLKPSPDAEPATMLRRLHFDLVGLPPSPEANKNFLQRIQHAGIELAWAAEVDELLASPQFGERWGRHWLDVARFAESSGKEANMAYPYAWRYRDYVIDAVNADLPYNQFLTEQIAGDLLPASNDRERARLLIATGFLAIGPKNLDEAEPLQFVADVIDEQIDTVTRAVIANSVACARCHDHKFDPFSMQDYYALAGIFASTKTFFGTAITPTNRMAGDPLPLPIGAKQPVLHASCTPEHVAHLKKQLAALTQELEDRKAAAKKALENGEDTDKYYSITDALRIFWTSGGIEGQLEKVDDQGNALPLTMGVLDAKTITDAPLLERGDVKKLGKPVRRAFPRVMEFSDSISIGKGHSGRLELAQWLTHPENPLTARVMTNRVWRQLFGAGLVASVDNFGFSGERPSHPELLDDLAVKFVSDGWSVKKLVRELVLSRTYRQASTYEATAFRVDPDNRLLWRASKRRLAAEAIRDAMLVASGELQIARPLGSLVGKEIGDRPISLLGLDAKLPSDLDGSKHRSVYLPVLRDRLPDVLDLFDFAEPSLVTGDRETTNVPVQALFLMNSPFVLARAEGLASRLQREVREPADQPRQAFELCFGRSPTETELRLAREFLSPNSQPLDEATARQRRVAFCQALLAAAEFRNVD